MADNPFDRLDIAGSAADKNPFDALDGADDNAVREQVESDPSLKAITSQFARSRLTDMADMARNVPSLDSVGTLDERQRSRFIGSELKVAQEGVDRANAAHESIMDRRDDGNIGLAQEARFEAEKRLERAKRLDEDNRAGVKRTITPQGLTALDRTIDDQNRKVEYYQNLVDQAQLDPTFVPDGQSLDDWRANLKAERQTLNKLTVAREGGQQVPAVNDPSGFGEFGRALKTGLAGTVPEMIGGALRQFGDSRKDPALTDIGTVLRDFGRGVRRDTPAQSAPELLKLGEKNAFGSDLKNYLAAKLGEGIGTSLPIIAGYMAGGPVAAVGGSGAMGVGQMRNALEEAFAEEGTPFPSDKAEFYVYTYGTAIGALESLTEVWGMSSLTGEAKKHAAKSLAKALAKGAVSGALMEGITEGLQELVEIHGVSQVTGKAIDWPEARRRMIESTAAGAIPGTAFGTVTAAGERKHAFDLALAKAKELGFNEPPKQPEAQPTPAESPQEAAGGPIVTPAASAPQDAQSQPTASPEALAPEAAAVLDAVDAILPDGIRIDRQTVADTISSVQQAIAPESAAQSVAEPAPAAPAVEPQAAIKSYLDEGGSLRRDALPDLAKRVGVLETELPAMLDKAVEAGMLRKTAGGMYRRAPAAPTAEPAVIKAGKKRAEIASAIDEALAFGRKIAPKGTQIATFSEEYRANTGQLVDAMTADGSIALATYAINPKGRMAHEVGHELVRRGQMSPQEMALLAERAEKVAVFDDARRQQYREAYRARYSQAHLERILDEEAAMHLIEARVNGSDFGPQINAIIDRVLQALERIANALRGKGYQTADDVIAAVTSGEMAQRDPVQEWMRAEDVTAFAMREELDMSPEARKLRAEAMGFDTSRVLYHGTNQNIQHFDISRLGSSTKSDSSKLAAFFTDSPELAGNYADAAARNVFSNVAEHEKKVAALQKEAGKLEKIANRTNKPADWDRYEKAMAAWEEHETGALQEGEVNQNIVPVWLRLKNPAVYDAKGGHIISLPGTLGKDLAGLLKDAKSKGHDGVIIRDLIDTPSLNDGTVATHYAVFDPKNIRSVNAAFDPAKADSPNLMFAFAGAEIDKMPAHPKRYKLVGGLGEPPEIGPARAALKAMASQLSIVYEHATEAALGARFYINNPELGTPLEALRQVNEGRIEAKQELAQLRREAEGQSFYYEIKDENDNSVGSAHGFVVGKKMYFDWLGAGRGSEAAKLGIRAIKDLREQVRKDFPKVTEFVGYRVSGARDKADAANKLQSVTMFAFAGERAKTADLEALSRAKEMASKGEDRTAIWNATGWFRGVDGKWRFEIDDASLKAVVGDGGVSHEALAAAYPEMRYFSDVSVGKTPVGGFMTNAGQVGGQPYSSISVRGPADQLRSIAGHELQHGVQIKEKFAQGANYDSAKLVPEYAAAMEAYNNLPPDNGWTSVNPHTPETIADGIYRRFAGEAEARLVQKRMDLTAEERRARPPWLDYDVPEEQQIVRGASEPMFAMVDRNVGQEMRRDLDQLGYFSGALEAAKRLKQAKGTPEQMLAMLKKDGVKEAEIEATGLDKFLQGKAGSSASTAPGGDGAFTLPSAQAKAARPGPDGLAPEAVATGRSRVLAVNDTNVYPDTWVGNHPYERADEIVAALNNAIPGGHFSVQRSGSSYGDSAYVSTPLGQLRISDHYANPKPGIAWSDHGGNAESMSPRKFVDLIAGKMDGTIERLLGGNSNGRPGWMSKEQWQDLKAQAASSGERISGKADSQGGLKQNLVTRDEIVSHLEQNRLGLNEVNYGGRRGRDAMRSMGQMEDRLAEIEASPELMRTNADEHRQLLATYNQSLRGYQATVDLDPRWQSHSLDPSNPTYRETVLHLPEAAAERAEKLRAARAAIEEDARRTGFTDYRALSALMDAERNGGSADVIFRSGHFPEPNIVGHMMTSMTRHEGKPVFTLDQIQSDWGQKLRDGGVRDEAKIAELKSRHDKALQRIEALATSDGTPLRSKISDALGLHDSGSRGTVDGWLNSYHKSRGVPDELNKKIEEYFDRKAELKQGARLIEAELRTAEASTPGHPLVNTTDQWTNTTLRRAVRQAAEADADYIAIPHGDTVLSYNPGDDHGMRSFYGSRSVEGIVPKNLRKMLSSLDANAPKPMRVETIETSAGQQGWNTAQSYPFDQSQTGFTLFPLTDKVKAAVKEQGQPLFAMRMPWSKPNAMAGLNTIVRDLARDLGIVVRQGLNTPAAKDAKRKAKRAGVDLTSYFDPATGVLRVRSMSDLSAVLSAAGEAVISRFDSKGQGPGKAFNPLETLLAKHAAGLLGQAGRAALWKTNPTYSGVELMPTEREALAAYMLAAHNERLAASTRTTDQARAKRAERDMLNAARTVARIGTRKLDNAIATMPMFDPVPLSIDDVRDFVDVRHNPASLVTAPILPAPSFEDQRAAFGQWFKSYLLDPQSAERQDAALYSAFEDLIDTNDPTLMAKLDSTQEAIAAYGKADPVAIMQSMQVSPARIKATAKMWHEIDRDGFLPTMADRLRQFYIATWDKTHPFYMAVRSLLEINQINSGQRLDINAVDNAYKLLRLAPSSHAWAGRDLEDGIRPRNSSKGEGPSLVGALKAALGDDRAAALETGPGSKYAKFTAYLISRRAVKLWDQFEAGMLERPPIGASRAVALSTVQTLESEQPQFMIAAEQVYGFQRNLLTLQRDAGLLTEDLYQTLMADSDYVPFLRDMSDQKAGKGKALGTAKSIIKKFRGSERDILDPVAMIAQKVYETRHLIAINDAKVALLKLAESAGPGAGRIAERLDPQQSQAMRVDLRAGLRAKAREMGIHNSDAIALVQLAQQLLGDDMTTSVFTKKQMQAGAQPITWAYENGVPVPIRLADGDLGRMMFETLESFGETHKNLLIDMMAVPTQLLRGTITSNPAFILRNMWVDGLMSYMYERTATPWVTQVKGFANAIRETDEVKEYAANAGLMGGAATNAFEKLRLDRDVRELVGKGYQPKLWSSPAAWLSEMARHPLRTIITTSEASETGTRARLYTIAKDRAKANGLNDVEAAYEAAFFAHDYIDYSRSGSRVQPVMRIIAFFNAAMQGLDRYYRLMAAKGDFGSAWAPYLDYRMGQSKVGAVGAAPVLVGKAAMAAVLGGDIVTEADAPTLTAREREELAQSAHAWFVSVMVMGGMSLLITALFGDDERLKEVPEELRATHWVIPLDGLMHLVPKEMPGMREALRGQMLRLPKAFETAWMANLVERIMLEARQNNPRWFENYVRDLKNTMLPPMAPQALQLFYELMTGTNMFTGRDIVPTWKAERLREGQWDEYTSEFAKWMGKKADISPYYIDHTLKGLGSSWARDMLSLNVPGTPWYKDNKPDKSLDDYVIARRFLWKAGKGADSAQKVREIMGAEEPLQPIFKRLSAPYSKLDASAATYKDYVKRRDPASASGLLDRLSPAERGFAIMSENLSGDASKYKMVHPMQRADKVLREVSSLQKEILADLVESKKKPGKLGEIIKLNPSEKAAARDILIQYQMMEAHNALVLTGETGWASRAYFDSASVLKELQAAVPSVSEEFERRMKKANILPFENVKQTWPALKKTIEADEFAALAKSGEKREIAGRIRALYGETR